MHLRDHDRMNRWLRKKRLHGDGVKTPQSGKYRDMTCVAVLCFHTGDSLGVEASLNNGRRAGEDEKAGKPRSDPRESSLGDPGSPSSLVAVVYNDLRRLASRRLAKEYGPQTLQATALVHEAWLRLGGENQPNWENRAQFFAAAAEAMRRILVDRARRRKALRHGGEFERVALGCLELGGN